MSSAVAWTKESVEASIRSQKRTCRGPSVFPVEVQKELKKAWENILELRNWELAKALQNSLESTLGFDNLEIPENDWEFMHRHIRGLYDWRKGCGFDVNEIIVAGELDGEIHSFACPNCGITVRYIPVTFEGVSKI